MQVGNVVHSLKEKQTYKFHHICDYTAVLKYWRSSLANTDRELEVYI